MHAARLRRLLGDDRRETSPLVNDGQGYALRLGEDQLDTARFRLLVAKARDERRACRPAEAAHRYRAALALWRGSVLDGTELPRADAELDDLRLAAVEEKLDVELALGAAAELVPELEQLVTAEPPGRNRVVSAVRVGTSPESTAATRDAIWVADVGDRTVARVDLASRRVRTLGGAPVAHQLVSGLNDDVWLSSFEEPVVTLIARRGRILERASQFAGPTRVEFPGSTEGLGGGGGYLWVTDPSDSGGRDTVGPLAVAVGAGAVWVTNREDRSVSRVDPATNRVVRTIRLGAAPYGIRFAHGRLWVTTQRCRSPVVPC